jgi:hypothetical protein
LIASPNPFTNIGFDDLRLIVADKNHSKYGRIGFPDSYRQGFESNDFGGTYFGVTELVK